MASIVQRIRDRIDPPRTLSFTRSGAYFVLMTLGVGVAAINTGNNLLFLLLGMLLAVIVASGILSEAVLRRLRPRRDPPHRLFAGRPAPGALEVGNPKTWPSLSVELREANIERRVGPAGAGPVVPPGTPWWKFWEEPERGGGAVADAYFLRVEPGSTQRREVAWVFPTRGVYELRELSLVTRFPFSLFEKTRRVESPATITVYPTPRPAPDWSAELRGGIGDVEAGERGRGDEYYGLREYRPGEDRRLIHWKRSAARGDLVIREHERKTNRAVRLHLYNAAPDGVSPTREVAFERGLGRVAGLLQSFAHRGWILGLRTLDETLPVGESTDLDALLGALARTRLRATLPEAEFGGPRGDRCADVLVALPSAANRSDGDWDVVLPIRAEGS